MFINYYNKYKSINILLISSAIFYILFTVFGFYIGDMFSLGSIEKSKQLTSNPLDYFNHNIVSLLYFLSGLFTFGLGSIYSLAVNGVMLGVSLEAMSNKASFLGSLVYIIPHGIFEIPAMIIAGAIGLYPWQLIYQFIKGDKRIKIQWRLLAKLSCIMVGLLFIAGCVEAWVTPYVIKLIL